MFSSLEKKFQDENKDRIDAFELDRKQEPGSSSTDISIVHPFRSDVAFVQVGDITGFLLEVNGQLKFNRHQGKECYSFIATGENSWLCLGL